MRRSNATPQLKITCQSKQCSKIGAETMDVGDLFEIRDFRKLASPFPRALIAPVCRDRGQANWRIRDSRAESTLHYNFRVPLSLYSLCSAPSTVKKFCALLKMGGMELWKVDTDVPSKLFALCPEALLTTTLTLPSSLSLLVGLTSPTITLLLLPLESPQQWGHVRVRTKRAHFIVKCVE
jgi:hypothetical protein